MDEPPFLSPSNDQTLAHESVPWGAENSFGQTIVSLCVIVCASTLIEKLSMNLRSFFNNSKLLINISRSIYQTIEQLGLEKGMKKAEYG